MRLTCYTITHEHDECMLHITDCNLRQVWAGDHTHGLGCDCPLPTSPSLERQSRNVIWSKSNVVWKENSLETCPGGYQPGVGLDQLPEWVLLLLQFCFGHRAGLQQRNTEDKQMPLFLECMHCSFICAVALFSMYSHTSSAPPLRSSLEATSQL